MNKVVIFVDKPKLEMIVTELPGYAHGDWLYVGRRLSFEYDGEPKSSLIIPCNDESWRIGYIEFGDMTTIKALSKNYLTNEERKIVLKKFCEDVLAPYRNVHTDIEIIFED